MPHRLALLCCVLTLASCQAAASPAPSSQATAAGSTGAATSQPSASASPAPTGLLLDNSDDAITDAAFESVIATPDGFLARGRNATGAVLASSGADGQAWQRLAAERVFGHPLDGIAVGPLGWAAAERIDTADGGVGAVLWHSDDGRHWTRVPDQADLGRSFPGPVVAGAWGFAMLGQAVDSGGTSAPRVWVSRDGLAWTQMPRLEDSWQLVAVERGIVALGGERSAITTDGISWVDSGTLPGGQFAGVVTATPLGSDVLAILNGEAGAGVWRGTVGGTPAQPTLSWQDAGLGLAPDAATLTTLATGPLGALVLGFDRQTLQAITWLSKDGRTWSRADLEPSAFGAGVPAIAAVGSRAFVVLGWYGNEGGDEIARPWISTDGLSWEGADATSLGALPGLPSEPCPSTDPTDAKQLSAMAGSYPTIPEAAWTLCFGNRELVLQGYVRDCGGCGGVTTYVSTVDWLLEPLGYAAFWLVGEPPPPEGGDGLSISVQVDPRHPVPTPERGAHVRVTGHFDDPAAQQCRLVPTESGAALPPAGQTIATCRHQFVVTAIKVLPG